MSSSESSTSTNIYASSSGSLAPRAVRMSLYSFSSVSLSMEEAPKTPVSKYLASYVMGMMYFPGGMSFLTPTTKVTVSVSPIFRVSMLFSVPG